MDKWGLNRVDRSPAVSYSRTRSTLLFLSEKHSACFSKAPEVEMPQNFPGRSTDTFSYSCYRNYTQRTKLQISQVSLVWGLRDGNFCPSKHAARIDTEQLRKSKSNINLFHKVGCAPVLMEATNSHSNIDRFVTAAVLPYSWGVKEKGRTEYEPAFPKASIFWSLSSKQNYLIYSGLTPVSC